MVTHARVELPNECCGILAGLLEIADESERPRIGRVLRRYPLRNEAESPIEYLSEPMSLFAADRDMRRQGTEVLAIYHSHPTSHPVPSRKDIERNNHGSEVVHIIISLAGDEPEFRAWWLSPDSFREADWELIDCAPEHLSHDANADHPND
jgi:proteasome lid subunit RPN8/RPN11